MRRKIDGRAAGMFCGWAFVLVTFAIAYGLDVNAWRGFAFLCGACGLLGALVWMAISGITLNLRVTVRHRSPEDPDDPDDEDEPEDFTPAKRPAEQPRATFN